MASCMVNYSIEWMIMGKCRNPKRKGSPILPFPMPRHHLWRMTIFFFVFLLLITVWSVQCIFNVCPSSSQGAPLQSRSRLSHLVPAVPACPCQPAVISRRPAGRDTPFLSGHRRYRRPPDLGPSGHNAITPSSRRY